MIVGQYDPPPPLHEHNFVAARMRNPAGQRDEAQRRVGRILLTDESRVKKHTKSTNHLTNTIAMVVVVGPLTPPAVWI